MTSTDENDDQHDDVGVDADGGITDERTTDERLAGLVDKVERLSWLKEEKRTPAENVLFEARLLLGSVRSWIDHAFEALLEIPRRIGIAMIHLTYPSEDAVVVDIRSTVLNEERDRWKPAFGLGSLG